MNDRGSQLPNLWGFCAEHLHADIISLSRQQLSFSLVVDQQKIHIATIYAKIYARSYPPLFRVILVLGCVLVTIMLFLELMSKEVVEFPLMLPVKTSKLV